MWKPQVYTTIPLELYCLLMCASPIKLWRGTKLITKGNSETQNNVCSNFTSVRLRMLCVLRYRMRALYKMAVCLNVREHKHILRNTQETKESKHSRLIIVTYTTVTNVRTFYSYMLWATNRVNNAATIQTPQTSRLCERKADIWL
jgi:hypothetical protein